MTRGVSLRGFRLHPKTPVADRVLFSVACNVQTHCWEWLGTPTQATGYGQITIAGKVFKAHRVSYEAFRGPIPAGLQIDHLCRNRICVNPAHLDPVTAHTNNHRSPITNATKTHCPQGHAYDLINTREWKGRRYCRACQAENMRRFYERQAAA